MAIRAIIVASFVLHTLSIDWNNGSCKLYLESSSSPFILLEDVKSNETKEIAKLSYPSYMEFGEAINVFYFHNKGRAMSIELLDSTELENCPYKMLRPSPNRILAVCDLYSDCYNCIANSGCTWSGTTNSGGSCIELVKYTEWYFKVSKCLNIRDAPHCKRCPGGDTAGDDYKRTIELPPAGVSYPANSFCYWEIDNPSSKSLLVSVNMNTVTLG